MDLNELRNKPERYVIGLMSGTSCDGIDAALCRIRGTGPGLSLKLVRHMAFPYPTALRTRLLNAHMSVHDICLLNMELGERFALAVSEIMKVADAESIKVDFVASHGHTVAHIPPRGDRASGTMQIGEPAVIAERTGLHVISDFRPRDMAAGGQGAPLVPYADWVLYSRQDRTLVCLNIGGIANFTVVTPEFEQVFAFDSGPGNIAIDGAVWMLTRGRLHMDEDGVAAAGGTIIEEFLEYLLAHPYFEREPPKSTGREEFGIEAYLQDGLANRRNLPYMDLVATVTAAVSYSIVRAFNWYIKPKHEVFRIVVSGGGAKNKTLVEWIARGLPDVKVRTSDRYGIPSTAREAIAFAVLGNETICGTPANVPGATGATHRVVLGKITPAQ